MFAEYYTCNGKVAYMRCGWSEKRKQHLWERWGSTDLRVGTHKDGDNAPAPYITFEYLPYGVKMVGLPRLPKEGDFHITDFGIISYLPYLRHGELLLRRW